MNREIIHGAKLIDQGGNGLDRISCLVTALILPGLGGFLLWSCYKIWPEPDFCDTVGSDWALYDRGPERCPPPNFDYRYGR